MSYEINFSTPICNPSYCTMVHNFYLFLPFFYSDLCNSPGLVLLRYVLEFFQPEIGLLLLLGNFLKVVTDELNWGEDRGPNSYRGGVREHRFWKVLKVGVPYNFKDFEKKTSLEVVSFPLRVTDIWKGWSVVRVGKGGQETIPLLRIVGWVPYLRRIR